MSLGSLLDHPFRSWICQLHTIARPSRDSIALSIDTANLLLIDQPAKSHSMKYEFMQGATVTYRYLFFYLVDLYDASHYLCIHENTLEHWLDFCCSVSKDPREIFFLFVLHVYTTLGSHLNQLSLYNLDSKTENFSEYRDRISI